MFGDDAPKDPLDLFGVWFEEAKTGEPNDPDAMALASVGEDGKALLEGIPAGEWTLKVWDEKSGEHSQSVTIRSHETELVEITLDALGFREQSHKNKYGEDYPPPDDEGLPSGG